MSSAEPINVILLAGPTASGKSAMALDLAENFNGTVINADSMQVYADLRVLTARPPADDEARAPHRLYGVLDGAEVCSAARWRDMAVDAIREEAGRGRLPIVCGGTGLYLKALSDGLSPMPEVPEEVRDAVRSRMVEIGSEALHAELAAIDPEMAGRLNSTDPQRIARAMEVIQATGRSLADWQRDPPEGPPADMKFHIFALVPPREELYARCDKRFRLMLEEGALEEVELLMRRNLPRARPVMRALGVPELMAVISGEMTLEAAEIKACTATRRYAKRQNTWIRNQIITKNIQIEKYLEKSKDEIFSFIRENGLTT